jgi:serine/threonine protein kinase
MERRLSPKWETRRALENATLVKSCGVISTHRRIKKSAKANTESMQSGIENTSTGNWRAAFAHAESLDGQPREAQREAIARLALEDAQLAHRVELMLGGDTTNANVDASVTKVLGNARVKGESAFKADDNIGAYSLIRPLGKGGMADVWLAQRTDGTLKRPVALKLPMALLPSPLLAERFARERDMLAQLDHANIARIYDAGTTASGQPFLALEFIDGDGLDHYCKAKRATINERVQLVMQVAQAVHHAHSRLVLHRDLKPSNILVTREGVVKVLDFGIAKLLTEERTAEETQFTRMTGAALTPKYAAPEQLLSETVTTSTDVYAIAVILYELLSGCVPFADQAKDLSARMATLNNPCRLLSENAISAPQVDALNASSERSVKRALAGDLSAILDKALRRAPNDRYPSALAFADDLQRYLTNRPVLARQGAAAYRIRKFFVRHRVPVAVAAMGTLAAAGLGLQALTQSQRAAQSQQRADSIDGLMESLFQGMSPDVAAKRTFTAKELLDRASGYVATTGVLDERALGATNGRMAGLYRDIGAYREALALNAKLLTEAQKTGDLPRQIELLRELANCAWRANDLSSAQNYANSARALLKSSGIVMEIELARLANIEGSLSLKTHEITRARDFFDQSEKLWIRLQPRNVEQLAWAIEGQAIVFRINGDLASAKTKLATVLELDKKFPTRGEMDRLHTRAMLATIDYLDGRFAQAHPILKRSCSEIVSRLSIDHPDSHHSCFDFAYASIRLGDWENAQKTIALLTTSDTFLKSDGDQATQLNALLSLYKGFAEDAEIGFRKVILVYRSLTQTTSVEDRILRFERYEAEAALRGGKTKPACEILARIERSFIATKGANNVDVAAVRVLLTVCALRANDRQEAKALISDAVDTFKQRRGEHHPFTLAAQAYQEFCEQSPTRGEIVKRLRNELMWQSGASQLIDLLENSGESGSLLNMPVVL